jgi:hypothetical protein
VPAEGEVVVTPHKTFTAFHGTDIDIQLRRRDVGHVILCGLTTNTCVRSKRGTTSRSSPTPSAPSPWTCTARDDRAELAALRPPHPDQR